MTPHARFSAPWTRSDTTASRFADAVADLELSVEQVESPRAVTSGADVLCTLTPSREPIMLGEWFRPGLHVNAVAAPTIAKSILPE